MGFLRRKTSKSGKTYNNFYIDGEAQAANTEQLQQNNPSARDDKCSLRMEKKLKNLKRTTTTEKGGRFLSTNCGLSSDTRLSSEPVWVSETLT